MISVWTQEVAWPDLHSRAMVRPSIRTVLGKDSIGLDAAYCVGCHPKVQLRVLPQQNRFPESLL